MGQKVNPISMRLQVSKNWRSKWFASKRDFAGWLGQDIKVRRAIEKKFETRAVINGIDIERSANMTTVTVHTAKAGVVIGRGGAGVAELKAEIEKNIAAVALRHAEDPIALALRMQREAEESGLIVPHHVGRSGTLHHLRQGR